MPDQLRPLLIANKGPVDVAYEAKVNLAFFAHWRTISLRIERMRRGKNTAGLDAFVQVLRRLEGQLATDAFRSHLLDKGDLLVQEVVFIADEHDHRALAPRQRRCGARHDGHVVTDCDVRDHHEIVAADQEQAAGQMDDVVDVADFHVEPRGLGERVPPVSNVRQSFVEIGEMIIEIDDIRIALEPARWSVARLAAEYPAQDRVACHHSAAEAVGFEIERSKFLGHLISAAARDQACRRATGISKNPICASPTRFSRSSRSCRSSCSQLSPPLLFSTLSRSRLMSVLSSSWPIPAAMDVGSCGSIGTPSSYCSAIRRISGSSG